MRLTWAVVRLLVIATLVLTGVRGARVSWADDADRAEQTDTNQMGGSGSSDEVQTDGNVIGMNTLVKPPIIKIANLDGLVTLYIRNPDEIVRNGVKVGDYISIIGQKINAFEFNVDIIQVDKRFASSGSSSGSSGNSNGGNGNGGNSNGGNGNSSNSNSSNSNSSNSNSSNSNSSNSSNSNSSNSNSSNSNSSNSNSSNGNGNDNS
jgi:hypothetical protein